ncbi:UNVERIFIED_ORG: hypothetical protein C7429_101443 [Pantoea allii]
MIVVNFKQDNFLPNFLMIKIDPSSLFRCQHKMQVDRFQA